MVRRKFLQLLSFVAVTSSTGFAIAGCDLRGAFAQLVAWAPVGFKAIAGVISLINPPAGTAISIGFNVLLGLWTNLTNAITAYQNDPSASKATTIGKLLDALEAAGSQVTSIISTLASYVSVPPVIISAATAVLGIIEATLSSIASRLSPTSAKKAKPPRAPFAFGEVNVPVSAVTNGPDFQHRYNKIMKAAGHSELLLR